MAGRPGVRADLSMSKPFSFPGYAGESIFQVRHRESLKKFIMYGGCGTRTHVPKNPWSVDDAICKVIGRRHKVPSAGLPIELALEEYLFTFFVVVALFDSTRAPDGF